MTGCTVLQRFSLIAIVILAAGLTACNNAPNTAQNPPAQTPAADASNVSTGDPANGNLAAADQASYQQPAPAASSSPQNYAPAPANAPPAYPVASGDSYNSQDYDQDASYGPPIQASEPPPPLPEYSQPPAPGEDYLWTPGYWSYAADDYYWVPGVWVLAPYVNALWTPPWWGFDNGYYRWHSGYWGPHIGYYGGIDYGYGYTGRGYYGAYWNNGTVYYNRTVTNVDSSRIRNFYNHDVPNDRRGNRVSYNGGRGGIEARPTPQELAVVRDPRIPPVGAQVQHMREASTNRAQFASGGRVQPAALVASRPLATPYKAPAPRPPATAIRQAAQPAPAPRAQVPAPQANRVPAVRPNEPGLAPQARQQATQTAPGRPVPQARQEPRPAVSAAPARPIPQARQQPVQQPTPQRPVPQARQEPRPAAAAPAPARPVPQARQQPIQPAPARPAPQARPEPRPAPQAQAPARPAPQARPEARPAPQAHPAPKPKDEQHKP